MRMIVRLQFVLKIAQFFLKLLGFLFERFHTLFDFGMLVTVLFDRHESPPERMKYYRPALSRSIGVTSPLHSVTP
jgi:hypothetical protein